MEDVMYGAILGDMVGAPYEFDRGKKTKNFEFWNREAQFTDDSVMSIAIADALIRAGREGAEHEIKDEVVKAMQKWGRKYPYAGYGGKFAVWLREYNPKPYGSYGNGSAMRVSAVGWLYDSLERTREVARWTAEVTHNHPEGVKGAEATASAIYIARNGASKEEINKYITENFGYDLTRTCDEIRPTYHHVESCQETVPEAMTAFLEGNDFEDVIRTAVSLGGDCDTLTCIAGGIAEAFYGVPLAMEVEVKSRLTEEMLRILEAFDELRGRGTGKGNELKWNSMIEEAISAFHEETNNEKFSAVIEAIYRRMYEGGSIMVPVIAPQNAFAMLDLEHMKVGDVVTAEEALHFKFQHLNTDDGKMWAVAFTSEEEYKKGASSDTISMEIRKFLEGFSGECPEEGIIINPWGDKLLLTREWINEILQLEKPKNELRFFVGDITRLPVDAIVNAANKSLLGGGGVDGAIHRAAGRKLLEECRTLHGCRTGEAKITKGYRLPAKHVIHTVGPIYSGTHTDEEDLYRCYYNSIELAAKNHLYSIAFPGISTGVYGYPKEEAAQVALTAILNWFDANEDYGMQVVVVNFSNADYEVYKKVIDNAKEGR
jgi:O-acetyl-ADP-ribose deacetylase (regulator of RNase III)/ADP-ribosylglycohydrolase